VASFNESMNELKALEYSSPSNVLHFNSGEHGYTFYGIYQSAHTRWSGWRRVYKAIIKHKYNLKASSRALYADKVLTNLVYDFYKKEFWQTMQLEFVNSQKIADEIFVFGVNTNPKRAIKKAQKLVGVKVDGWIGAKTLKALNTYDPKKFDVQFDLSEIAFYRYLAFFSKRKAQHRKFYRGWVNRARAV